MTFETIIANYNTLIIFKFIDMLLAMFPIGYKVEEASVSIPF